MKVIYNLCLTLFTKRKGEVILASLGFPILPVLFHSCTIFPILRLPFLPVGEASAQLSSWVLPPPLPVPWPPHLPPQCQSNPEVIPISSVSRNLLGQGFLFSLAVNLHWKTAFSLTERLRITPFHLFCAKKVAVGGDRGPAVVTCRGWGWDSSNWQRLVDFTSVFIKPDRKIFGI